MPADPSRPTTSLARKRTKADMKRMPAEPKRRNRRK